MTTTDQSDFLATARLLKLPAEPYPGEYSGRGMFGERTVAVVIRDIRTATVVSGEIARKTGGGFEYRVDMLGLDFIVY